MKITATVRVYVVAACLLFAAMYLATASRAEMLPARESLAGLPMRIGDWIGSRDPDLAPEIVALLGVDEYVMRTYVRPADRTIAGLYIGYHASQRQGDTIHSPLNCLPGAGWQPLDQGRLAIEVPAAMATAGTGSIEVNRVVIGKGLDRQLVLYWYQSPRRVVASEYWGKIYTVLDAVRYNRTDAALIRIVMPIPDGTTVERAEADAVTLAQSIFPMLSRYLPS